METFHSAALPAPASIWRALALGAMVGCASSPPKPCENPPPFYLTLEASPRLNPDAEGQSLTTHLLIIQLRSLNRVATAQLEDIWRRPKEILGEDFLQMNELFVNPGSSSTAGFMRDPKAIHVLLVALFRQPQGDSWRVSAGLPEAPPEKCSATAGEVKKTPAKGDLELHFFLENFRVENRTPMKKKKAGIVRPYRGVET